MTPNAFLYGRKYSFHFILMFLFFSAAALESILDIGLS